MLHTVTFSTFMVDVPPFWRLVLAIGITVGVTLLMVWLFHGRVLALNAKDEMAKDARNARKQAAEDAGETFDEPPLPAPAYELSGRAIGWLIPNCARVSSPKRKPPISRAPGWSPRRSRRTKVDRRWWPLSRRTRTT